MSLRVLLVQTPLGMHDRFDTAPPLGLLILGGMAKEAGAEVQMVDLNLQCLLRAIPSDESMYEVVLKRIMAFSPDVVGFTSMGLDGHLALELARRIKNQAKDVCCVLGGPHFSSVAAAVLESYPWIDAVVCGAGESGFQSILRSRKSGKRAFHRSVQTRDILGNTATTVAIPEMSAKPDYSLVKPAEYFSLNPRRLALVEQGRGCVFDCSFCYSRGHWEKLVERDTEELIVELRGLVQLGFRKIFSVQDNFLNNPKNALALARRITEEKLPLTWQGYATVSQLSERLITALSESGCSDLFLGVDAVTEKAKTRFRKPLFRSVKDLTEKIICCITTGIQPTCAFLLEGPFTENSSELEETLRVSLQARLSGANIRLNCLSTYPGTGISCSETVCYSEQKPRLLLDCPEVTWKNPFAEISPALFPFHNTSLNRDEELSFVQFTHAAFTLINLFPWTLKRLIADKNTSLCKVIASVSRNAPPLLDVSIKERREVESQQFLKNFVGGEPDEESLRGGVEKSLLTIHEGENT